jgi:transcription initiation factor IIF auxiliary subunit
MFHQFFQTGWGNVQIRKKVFYAKNDHGNHLNDDHPPDYGIHLEKVQVQKF